MSMPFFAKEFSFRQPDGTHLQVRGWGNQHHAVFETMDGYTVVQDPATGYFQYARSSDDGEDLEPTGARPGITNPQTLGLAKGARLTHAAAKARGLESAGLPRGGSRWE
jgi:hypothetical protein